MKSIVRFAAVFAAGVIAAAGLCGCSELIEGKRNIDGLMSDVDGLRSSIENGDLDGLRSVIENGNFDEYVSGLDTEELQNLISGLEEVAGTGREKIDTKDKMTIASGVSASCSGMYSGVVDGRVNSDIDKEGYTVQLPKSGAPLSERIRTAGRLTVEDALRYADSKGVSLDGIYYLSSDAGEDYPKGTIIAETDDYFSEAKSKAKQLRAETTFEEIYG